MDVADYLNLSSLSYGELILRIILATAFGFVLGMDRDNKNKPVDFRAYMIVALISCTLAILAEELFMNYHMLDNIVSIDPAKVIAGVMTGIGFLGAGAIIKLEGNQVVGTATGASIWASGGMGLTLGFGYYGLATAVFTAIALILIAGGVYREKAQGRPDKEKIKKK